MKMVYYKKNLLILFFIVLFSTLSQAQFQILRTDLLSELKNTKTIVFMPARDTFKNQVYRKIMEKYWTITPVSFKSYTQYLDFKNAEGYSYLLFGDDQINDGTSINSYVYFELWLWQPDPKNPGTRKKVQIARLELYPDPETTFDPSLIYDYRYHTEGHIFNWTPGMFKNYVQVFDKYISNGIERNTSKPEQKMDELQKLKNNTLYIPDYVLLQNDMFHSKLNKIDAAELLQDYPYPYKIVSSEELSAKISEASEPIYYLLFVRSNSDKYLAVMEGKEGEIVYHRHSPLSFNVKKADLKKLACTIEGKKSCLFGF
jgi:hypothetical protein